MTLRRQDGTEAVRDKEYDVYELCFEWDEVAYSADPAFFRPILESATFQRALDSLQPNVIQLARSENGYSLRVLNPHGSCDAPDRFEV